MIALTKRRLFQFLGTGPEERRGSIRYDTLYAATIRSPNTDDRPCYVRNISPLGALLEFENGGTETLPRSFRLIIEDEGFAAHCELRHRTGNFVGIAFTSHLLEALMRFGGLQG